MKAKCEAGSFFAGPVEGSGLYSTSISVKKLGDIA